MRLLFPLRSSAIALTGSGLNARAISSISSGGWKERITNFVPRGVLFKFTLRIAAEENLATGRRHSAVHKHFGKIVDDTSHPSSRIRFTLSSLVPRNKHCFARGPGRYIEELLAFHPLECGNAQVRQRVIMRAFRLMAHDSHGVGVVSATSRGIPSRRRRASLPSMRRP